MAELWYFTVFRHLGMLPCHTHLCGEKNILYGDVCPGSVAIIQAARVSPLDPLYITLHPIMRSFLLCKSQFLMVRRLGAPFLLIKSCYPLVIQHSHGKLPIYTLFSH